MPKKSLSAFGVNICSCFRNKRAVVFGAFRACLIIIFLAVSGLLHGQEPYYREWGLWLDNSELRFYNNSLSEYVDEYGEDVSWGIFNWNVQYGLAGALDTDIAFTQDVSREPRLGAVLTMGPSRYSERLRSQSVQDLAVRSDLVVEVYVQAIYPSVRLSVKEGYVQTDSLLRVVHTLKGPTIPEIVVSQTGGALARNELTVKPTDYALMQPGEHYILFLKEAQSTVLPVRTNIPRYAITEGFFGLFKLDGTEIALSPGMTQAWHERYRGVSSTRFLDEVRTSVSIKQSVP
jgi:hypothetical protein